MSNSAKQPAEVSLETILEQIRQDARSNRDLGDRFERLIVQYLQLDPLFVDRFSEVWMWSDWPGRENVGDVGVDIVAKERASGDFCAIQCKFYLPEHTLSKADLDSFFAALGKPAFKSGMIISTTDKWGKNAEDALDQTKPVTRLSLHDLAASPIDWSKFDPRKDRSLKRTAKKRPRAHQIAAMDAVQMGFSEADRGKLIMACGTGKTYTALQIAEAICQGIDGGPAYGHVLFLVPSLSLMSQTLREWTAEARHPITSLAVCSDRKVGKRRAKNDDNVGEITVHDLAFPATTDQTQLVTQYEALKARAKKEGRDLGLTVVFSTYQSIDAVSLAQKAGLPEFDLIICDEAHRTTGVTLAGEDESAFVRVHDAEFIKGKKRLYMTATPRIYGDDAKSKAKEATAELASMDDEAIFGPEFYRLGFGEAVSKNLLSDYKVLVLAVDEKYVSKTFQKQIASKESELNLEDATKIVGCWNGLEKRFEASATNTDLQGDLQHMRRAVAFSRSIADSKKFVEQFAEIVESYKADHPDVPALDIEADHVDGSFDALRRNSRLEWLKEETPPNTCRILSNARCLSEGVDVPALDAVLFLNPRNSVIDVVQSVGRVMRRAEGKRYGYIILPIGIPADKKPEEALKDNERYKVVWQVLQALRAHDDRFNATINQIELNKNRPDNVQVIGIGGGQETEDPAERSGDSKPVAREVQGVFSFPELEEWKDAIYAKMVKKVGDRAYWETWAQDIAKIAETHITRIKALLDDPKSKATAAFDAFLKGLQQNLNPAVSREDAIEMLAQHSITKPVFDALFANYAFTEKNPVSQAMQKMLDILHEQSLEKETATLEKFYASVRDRAKGLDNAEARQKVVIELYEEFFKNAFPRMHERLGIVYTPIEVVDFIIHSVQDVLRDEFNSGLGEKDVHIIDPFTGTGTFIVRLLQSGLIPPDKLEYKYKHELHANEIVLLAYYIAAINIEETFHGLRADSGKDDYLPFDGIVLTDTFQLYESNQGMIEGTFPENTARVKRQKQSPIRVVIANPPYSAKQDSENDSNKNLTYPVLDNRISDTYTAKSNAVLNSSMFDSYIRAVRWATDRIDQRGVIGIVTNGSYIDANAMDGFRASLADEFTSLYIFNLRGNQRTSGEVSKQEGGKIFGSGSRAPIAISLLVKNPAQKGPATLRYYDIGDYLSRDEKLKIVKGLGSVNGIDEKAKWTLLSPNHEHDWINQRDPAFGNFVPLGSKGDEDTPLTIFENYSQGIMTSRDKWCYNFATARTLANMNAMIEFYNDQVASLGKLSPPTGKQAITEFVEENIDADPKKISWSRALKASIGKQRRLEFNAKSIRVSHYRAFCRHAFYFDRNVNEMIYQMPRVFPRADSSNLVIIVPGNGGSTEFSTWASNSLVDYNLMAAGAQCFPLYLYEKADESGDLNFDKSEVIDGYRRRDAITDAILKTFRSVYGATVTKEDIFYYVYGVLHSPEYRTRFAADLKKMLPRIPLTKETVDFWAFSQAGRDLAHWHLNYETVEPYELGETVPPLINDEFAFYRVKEMKFAPATAKQKAEGLKVDKTRIVYNANITLSGIPLEAYDYVVNGKPAIEWIIERYRVSTDKSSGIINDANDWCREHNNPRYIVDLIKRIVRVSLETMKIVRSLPALNEQTSPR